MHHSVIALYNNRKTQSINHTKSIVQSSSKSSWCLHHTKQQPVISLYCEKYKYKTIIIPVQGKWNKITEEPLSNVSIIWRYFSCQNSAIVSMLTLIINNHVGNANPCTQGFITSPVSHLNEMYRGQI